MAGRVTIQDIADALGVSRNTVSKAINNTGILADATRDRILKKAVEMGYKQFSYVKFANLGNSTRRPGTTPQAGLTISQAAAQQQTASPVLQDASSVQPPTGGANTIALFTTSFLGNSHFASTMLDKFQSELTLLGYGFTMYRVSQADLQQLTLPNSFHMETTAGIICFEMFSWAYSDMLCDLGIPILFVDAPAPSNGRILKADRLLMENRSNIFSLVADLGRHGKKKIGYIGERFHCLSFFERYMAYREALITLDLPYIPEYCLTEHDPGHAPEQYRQYLKDHFKNMKALPDVFFCANDFVALEVLTVLRELSYSVPQDVYLCGFDDSPESRIVTPALTTIHIHSQIMGFSAVQLLISRIKEPTLNYRTIYTETTLIRRASTSD